MAKNDIQFFWWEDEHFVKSSCNVRIKINQITILVGVFFSFAIINYYSYMNDAFGSKRFGTNYNELSFV